MFNELNTFKHFFEDPTKEFNVREIARLCNIAPATASSYLKLFEKNKILKKRKVRVYDFYSANLESDSYTDLKVYYSIRKLKESGLIKALNDHFILPTIILFGSTAEGTDTLTSDIDLCVIAQVPEKFPDKEKYEKILKKELQLLIVGNISKIPNKHLISSIANGINIQGMISWTLTSAFKETTLKRPRLTKK